jgi:penicillin-binding protein 2
MQSNLNGHDSGRFRSRFRFFFAVLLIMISCLIVRMWYLQVIRGGELSLRSENNSVRLRKIRPLRGLVMDTNGQILVDNQPSFDIIFMPNHARKIQDAAIKLKTLYDERSWDFPSDFSSQCKKRLTAPVKIEKNIDWEKLALVETHAIDLPGVAVEVVPIRQYLGGEMTAHLIGYTGEINREDLQKDISGECSLGDISGKYGLEKYLDPYIRGKSGAEQVEVNVLGREIKLLGRIQPASGYNVELTIDARLQKAAWEALKGRAGAVVAMDPRNGSVLALVSSPSFDPNLFNGGISFEDWESLSTDPSHPMENRAISGQYPPGSTYKLIIAAAALEEGLITPETKFFCDGSFGLGNRNYRCWQKKGHGRVDLHKAIVESCDVYFYNVGKLLGVDKIAEYARGFGLSVPTGIDLNREKGGLVPTKNWKISKFREPWQMGETISIAIGQGFNLVTPLQLANAYASLANGGIVYRPRLIKTIKATDGQVIKAFGPEQKGRIPVSQEHMDILRYALWGVVNEKGGTGRALMRKEADVCGKTGTSQVVGLPENEKARRRKINLSRYRDHALFVCFAPYRHPEIAVSVIVENAGHGGSVAAPVARKVIDAYFKNKVEVPHTKQPVLAANDAPRNMQTH